MLNLFEENESEVRTYCRSFPAIFKKAAGSFIFDTQGHRYIDLLSAAGSLNYGHNDPDIIKAVIDHLADGHIVQSLDLHTDAKQTFIRAFIEHILKPRQMHYKLLFPGPTGTNAVEAAFKLARKSTGRKNIISFSGAFHGMSLGALAATTNKKKRAGAGVTLTDVTILPYDNAFGDHIDTATLVEQMVLDPKFGIDAPAAFIVEVIQGEGGLTAASSAWLKRIEKLCRQVGALLIVDDIQCGCGRSGTFFSFENSGITPDIVLLSKSLSGFGTPLSLVLVNPANDVLDPGEHNGTFRGNNLGFVGATAAIEKFWKNNELEQAVKEKERYILNRVNRLINAHGIQNLQYVGRGLLSGIRFTDPQIPGGLSDRLYEKGFVVETCGPADEVLKFLPSLVIDTSLLASLFDAIEHDLEQLFDVNHQGARAQEGALS